MKYSWLIFLWIGFGISHSYLVSEGFVRRMQDVLGRYYSFYRLSYNIISFITFFLLFYHTKHIDSVLIIKINPIVQAVLSSVSAVILAAAFLAFDPLEFIGLKQIGSFYTEKVLKDDKAGPVRTGLYGIVRHPMYSAAIVLMWSLDSTLAEIITKVILTIYIVIGTILEERKLVKEFGVSYIEYQKEVPMLIPFLK